MVGTGKEWNGELSTLFIKGRNPPSQVYRNLTGGAGISGARLLLGFEHRATH